MRIVVTGATGFVGRRLLADGAAAGHQMVGASRQAAPAGAGAWVTVPSLADQGALRAAFAGADAVVHCAARVHIMHREGPEALARFREVNRDGTGAVAEAARAAGVARLVVLSTAKVLGEGGRSAILRDDSPVAPVGAYAQSKAEGEELVASQGGALRWTIIRPPLVYGPGVGGNFRRLLQLAGWSARLPLPLGAVRNRRSLVHVGNLASAALAALASERAHGRRFLVADGAPVSTADLLRAIGRAGGRPVRLWDVPPGAMRAALSLVGRGAEAERLFESFEVDASGIGTALGWTPPWSFEQALLETVQWWRDRGAEG